MLRWGSSCAAGDGGRVRTPAPTAYPKVRLIFRRARCPQRAVSGRPGVPPLTSAARGCTVCAPTEKKKKRAVNDLWEGEFSRRFAAPPFDKGGFGRRAFFRSRSRLLRGHPHPPPSGAPSPLKGEGLRAAPCGRPYGIYRSGSGLLLGPVPDRSAQDSHQERWFGNARRSSGTAPAEIFANPGPSGPD